MNTPPQALHFLTSALATTELTEQNPMTGMNWMTLSNASMQPSPHCREIPITMCCVWDTIWNGQDVKEAQKSHGHQHQPTTKLPCAASTNRACQLFFRRPDCKQNPQHSPDSINKQQISPTWNSVGILRSLDNFTFIFEFASRKIMCLSISDS